MDSNPPVFQSSRRNFLMTSGTVLAAAALNPSIASASPTPQETGGSPPGALPKDIAKKIPIGVFDPAFPDWPLDEMIDKFSQWGVEAVEIGTGGYPGSH